MAKAVRVNLFSFFHPTPLTNVHDEDMPCETFAEIDRPVDIAKCNRKVSKSLWLRIHEGKDLMLIPHKVIVQRE